MKNANDDDSNNNNNNNNTAKHLYRNVKIVLVKAVYLCGKVVVVPFYFSELFRTFFAIIFGWSLAGEQASSNVD
jgi:hypothetical protein